MDFEDAEPVEPAWGADIPPLPSEPDVSSCLQGAWLHPPGTHLLDLHPPTWLTAVGLKTRQQTSHPCCCMIACLSGLIQVTPRGQQLSWGTTRVTSAPTVAEQWPMCCRPLLHRHQTPQPFPQINLLCQMRRSRRCRKSPHRHFPCQPLCGQRQTCSWPPACLRGSSCWEEALAAVGLSLSCPGHLTRT